MSSYQSKVYAHTRGEYLKNNVQRPVETLLPFFYIAEDGNKRLYQVKYERQFLEPTYPRAVTPKLIEKYGEPTRRETDTDVRIEYFYDAGALPPQEFYTPPAPELSPEDQGNTTEAIYNRVQNQRAGKYRKPTQETRRQCQMARLKDVDATPSRRCSEILSYEFSEASFYFAGLKTSGFLSLKIDSPDSPWNADNEMVITLSSPLHLVTAANYTERKMEESIAAAKSTGGVSGLDDL